MSFEEKMDALDLVITTLKAHEKRLDALIHNFEIDQNVVKTLNLTSEEFTLLFYMAGYSYNKLPAIYEDAYEGLMKKISQQE